MDQELGELSRAWLGGEVVEQQREALLARLRADADFRAAFVDELRLFGMLKVVRSAPPRWLGLEDLLGWSSREPLRKAGMADAVAARIRDLPSAASPSRKRRHWRWMLAASILLCGLVALIGYGLRTPAPPVGLSDSLGVAVIERLEGIDENDADALTEGKALAAGPFSLRQGSATLAFASGVKARIEGPVDLDLLSESGVFCRRGVMRIEVPPEVKSMTASGPGLAITSSEGGFELNVAEDGQCQVEVFGGSPKIAILNRSGRTIRTEVLVGGQVIRVDPRHGQNPLTIRGDATTMGPIPAKLPRLKLDPGYAKVVLADRPAGYWRFETIKDGIIPNEVGSGPGFCLIGLPKLTEPADGNHSLYFPASLAGGPHGALTDGTWKPGGTDFAVECWVMPRLTRQSAIIGVLPAVESRPLDIHAMLLELTGSTSPASHPRNTLRALLRTPVGRAQGVNIFSPATYKPLQWQHVVAQRSGELFELYVNGTLAVSAAAEPGESIPRCRLLLGALYADPDGKSCTGRPFAGLFDELAVYDHALSAEQVLRHYRLGNAPPSE